jgi:hypothetical protein
MKPSISLNDFKPHLLAPQSYSTKILIVVLFKLAEF